MTCSIKYLFLVSITYHMNGKKCAKCARTLLSTDLQPSLAVLEAGAGEPDGALPHQPGHQLPGRRQPQANHLLEEIHW